MTCVSPSRAFMMAAKGYNLHSRRILSLPIHPKPMPDLNQSHPVPS